ncbi:hypothetical protein AGOR_G00143060 [Albula goreensis]|uniref:Uncharacterized protein n=1 Tax=Albula goreensis TaxID=1534307 RepID=A0A8T3D9V7_9TELE|nr:hypothetical protein AGOR_G00143060 [Albula goreensis]
MLSAHRSGKDPALLAASRGRSPRTAADGPRLGNGTGAQRGTAAHREPFINDYAPRNRAQSLQLGEETEQERRKERGKKSLRGRRVMERAWHCLHLFLRCTDELW